MAFEGPLIRKDVVDLTRNYSYSMMILTTVIVQYWQDSG